jgi:hypothetical protein
LAVGIDEDCDGIRWCCCHPANVPNKAAVVYICTINTDTNYVICCSHVTASAFTQGNIFAAVAIKSECTITDSRVRIAATVVSQSAGTEGGVATTCGVARERGSTKRRVGVLYTTMIKSKILANVRERSAISEVRPGKTMR